MKNIRCRAFALCLSVLLLCTALFACAEKTEDEEIPERMQSATLDGSLYRLYVPNGWNLLTDTGISGAYASMIDMTMAYVHEYDNPESLTPTVYWQTIHQAQLNEAFPKAREMTAEDPIGGTLGGADALFVTYRFTSDGEHFVCTDALASHGERMLVLSCLSREDTYDTHKDAFSAIITNFVFSETPYHSGRTVNTVDPDADAPTGMKLASNNDVAYRFYVPESWVIDKALPTSSAYVSESDRTNVSVVTYLPEQSKMSAQEYWELCQNHLSAALSDFTLQAEEETTLGDRPANTYTYTARMNGKTYRFSQTIASWRGMVYTVTYTATEENFDTHREEYLSILSHFTFRK